MPDSMILNQNFNNFEIIQQFKEHIQIKAPCLFHDPERARIVEILICKSDAVESAVATPAAASVSIQFNPVVLPLEKLFVLIDTLLGNIGRKVSNTLGQIQPGVVQSNRVESVSSFIIDGMECTSCALSLELILNRQCDISMARIDYQTSTLIIRGQLSTPKIGAIICDSGFNATLLETDISIYSRSSISHAST